jgi:wyosine [tRNA(Phe)-imidazoG37] synthetase (radical SAM superfamily)
MSGNLFTQHERYFQENRFVYPVLSRRSGGISVGINLNPDKVCNFHCVYCQVNRVSQGETRFVDSPLMQEELRHTLTLVKSGDLYQTDKFQATPAAMRRLSDIAFSGDGEPTTHRNFDEVVEAAAQVRNDLQLQHIPLVLITNASMFHRPHIQRALRIMDEQGGQVWAKLDAGTREYYELINRAPFKFESILENITAAARQRPLIIQTLFMRIHGDAPPESEWQAYCQRLREITASGGQLQLIQIYTIARMPEESYVSSLSDQEVDRIVDFVRAETGLTVKGYYGADYAPPAAE